MRRAGFPTPGTTYQIQYDGNYDSSVPADVYDIDGEDSPQSFIDKLHGMGRKVVCYISVGTWENWRKDAGKFPKSVIGKPDGGWKGERWLDVRQTQILEPIMTARLQMCKAKHFDGVDPDNMDGFENRTGFKISYKQQLAYNAWVAQEAHALGLTADEKGDNDQVQDMAKYFDFAVTEECWKQGWCNEFSDLHRPQCVGDRRRVQRRAGNVHVESLRRHGEVRRKCDAQAPQPERLDRDLPGRLARVRPRREVEQVG